MKFYNHIFSFISKPLIICDRSLQIKYSANLSKKLISLASKLEKEPPGNLKFLKTIIHKHKAFYRELNYSNENWFVISDEEITLLETDIFMKLLKDSPIILFNKEKKTVHISEGFLKTTNLQNYNDELIEHLSEQCSVKISSLGNRNYETLKLQMPDENNLFFTIRVLDLFAHLLTPNTRMLCLEDITEFKFRETQQIQQDRIIELFIENANEALLIAQEGRIAYCNKHVELISGYNQSELLSKSFEDLIHPEDREKVLNYHKSRMKGDLSPFKYSFRFYTKNGSVINVSVNTIPISWNGKPAGLAFLANLDERQLLNETLMYNQKMELLGKTAGAVFHDFNNLMTIIISNIEMIEMLSGDPKLSPYVHNILSASEQATALTNQLRFLGKKKEIRPEKINLNEFIETHYRFFEKILPKGIVLQIEFEPHLPSVILDKTNLQQILLNLLFNARDAVGESGTIKIKTFHVEYQSPETFEGHLSRGNYVCLQVSDTGCGIPEEKLNFIFEPFFSTKASRGTGLGLTIVHSIVKQFGGGINVTSHPGEGTTFKIYLPAASGKSGSFRSKETPSLKDVDMGHISMVLIEDDTQIRDLVKSFMHQLNARVTDFGTVEQAISFLESTETKPDLIVSDIYLPGESGLSIYHFIEENHYQIPVLFISAFPETDFELPESGNVNFLSKPFGIKEFMRTVESILNQKES